MTRIRTLCSSPEQSQFVVAIEDSLPHSIAAGGGEERGGGNRGGGARSRILRQRGEG